MNKILVGADPELFVKHKGELVSGYGLIPGTKAHPHPVKHGAVQVDGMALEFNIDPASTSVEFVNNVFSVLDQLKQMVPEHEFVLEATVRFKEECLKTQPREALELGCDPDFNAYTETINPSPNPDSNIRTAAGHVHVGWTEGVEPMSGEHMRRCFSLAKQMDLFLGVPFVLLNDCIERKKMYGRAGTFRPKTYGMEYRVLSNKWIVNAVLMMFVYNHTIKAIEELLDGEPWYLTYTDGEECINNNNKTKAEQIVNELGIDMEQVNVY